MISDRSRRRFIGEVLATAAAGLGAGSGCSRSGPPDAGRDATAAAAGSKEAAGGMPGQGGGRELFSISLAEWSLHRTLQAGELDHLEFARVAAGLGLGGIEYVNTFFFERARDRDYLAEMQARAEDQGVRSLLIMCDREGRLGDPDPTARTDAVENHHKWVEAAAFLGCHSIRVNAASEGTPEEQHALVVDGLGRLVEYADPHGIDVIVENHGGLSSNGAWLAGVIAAVDHPRAGTLPDFGNFRISDDERYDNYRGVRELMPYARAVSAKSYDFDEAGNETTVDYERMLRIVLDAGYRGFIGIEYEGRRLSEMDGIRATQALLERLRDRLAPQYPG